MRIDLVPARRATMTSNALLALGAEKLAKLVVAPGSITGLYLSAGYADEPIVHELSVSVPAGSVITLIGPNGAGKSTLLKTIYGLSRVFSGRIVFKGADVTRTPPVDRLRLGIGLVPQGRCNLAELTVSDNLALGAWTLPRAGRSAARDRVLSLFPMLAGRLGGQAGNLSGGEQQILEMAMVLEASPGLMLLDEPSLGLCRATRRGSPRWSAPSATTG